MGTAERLATRAEVLETEIRDIDTRIEAARATLHISPEDRARHRGLKARRAQLADQLHLHRIAL